MKTITGWIMIVAASMSFMLLGCKSVKESQAAKTESMLTAAGFQTRVANSADAQAKLQTIKPYKVLRYDDNGKLTYVYADPGRNLVFFGNQDQYAEYQRLAVKAQTAQQNLEAAEMMQTPPTGWWWW